MAIKLTLWARLGEGEVELEIETWKFPEVLEDCF